jgi:TfoX/Sxy family transcriptional regulator of competence genes
LAYSEALAQRIRDEIGEHPALVEKQMFGGLAFMIGGNMSVGVAGDDLMVRVGKENHDEALAQPHVRPFDVSGRPPAGWVLVAAAGTASDADLSHWVDAGVGYAESLPAK